MHNATSKYFTDVVGDWIRIQVIGINGSSIVTVASSLERKDYSELIRPQKQRKKSLKMFEKQFVKMCGKSLEKEKV